MKLEGIRISNVGSFRKHFNLSEVWKCVDNGVLAEFEMGITGDGQALAKEIADLLGAFQKTEQLSEKICNFYKNYEWNTEELRQSLKPYSQKSLDQKRTDFYTRNREIIEYFTGLDAIKWNNKKAGYFYFFLLIMLQVRPREVIEEDAINFIKEKLYQIPDEKKQESDETDTRIYPYEAGVLYLRDGRIFNGQKHGISPAEEWIESYAYTDEIGLIAFTREGEISACTEGNTRYEIEKKIKRECKAEEKIIQVSAYGSIYILLTNLGNVLTNVEDDIKEWKDVRRVNAGLNSLTAIRGNARSILQLGMNQRLTEYSDVQAVYTKSGEGMNYAVLKTNGILITDDGYKEEKVTAIGLSGKGYFYSVGRELFRRDYGTEVKFKWEIPLLEGMDETERKDGRIVEICPCRGCVYFRYIYEDKELLGCADEEDFTAARW